MARNTVGRARGVPAAVIEAARGMGMTARQILMRVEVPLALPVLLAGLRIVTVQAIGLAVVAALIGAGGLGSFVFLGLGQTALDLVLLGALPAILHGARRRLRLPAPARAPRDARAMIELDHVGKRYDGHGAVDDLSLAIEPRRRSASSSAPRAAASRRCCA